jgi:hypothetical protein
MMTPITIAIPTYARTEKLLTRLRELLPQLNSADRLLIFDNSSAGFISGDFPEFADPRVQLTINSANIWANANVAKCLCSVDSGWVWLTSDDDPIEPNAVEILKAETLYAADCCFINFTAKGRKVRPEAGRLAVGLKEFIKYNDGFEGTLLISNGAFNVTKLRRYMKDAYSAIWMNCPHIAPVISCLQAGGSMFYSQHSLVRWAEPDPNESWPIVSVFHLLEVALMVKDQDLADKLREMIAKALPSRTRFVTNLCFSQLRYGRDWRMFPYAKRVLAQLSAHKGLLGRMAGYLLYLSLHRPRETLFILSFVYRRLKGRDLLGTIQSQRFEPFL